MRLWILLAALTALTSLGCVEDKPAKGDAAKATTTKPADPPPAAARAERPPMPDDTDPVLKAAEVSSQRVAGLEERIDAALSEVSDGLSGLSAGDVLATDLTTEKLLTAVTLLRQSGERLVSKYPAVKADLVSIVKANGGVKVGYGRAKELYLDKAKAETGELKSRYETLAELCDSFIRTNDERTATYAAFAKDLDKAVAKVERHVVFLTDFETFLKLNPATNGAKRRAEFTAELNTFAEQVLKLGEVLRQFRDKVRAGAVSKKLQAEHERVAAAAVAARTKAAADAEWEQRLAADRRAKAAEAAAKPDAEPATDRVPAEPTPTSVATTASPAVPTPVAACPPPVRWVPVVVTRCVNTLVPVTVFHTQRGLFGRCRTVATTHYQCQTRPVSEVRYVAVQP